MTTTEPLPTETEAEHPALAIDGLEMSYIVRGTPRAVLRGVSFEVRAGEAYGLVGESGCGKSTFVNLMMRFYDPDFGQILLDGVDIKEYNLHDLRNAIALVM